MRRVCWNLHRSLAAKRYRPEAPGTVPRADMPRCVSGWALGREGHCGAQATSESPATGSSQVAPVNAPEGSSQVAPMQGLLWC